VAAGHITGLGESITAFDDVTGSSEHLTGLIQTDAGIQPGDSGGPLVNAHGLVIGMDTAASSGLRFQPKSATVGFAIPINRALFIAAQIAQGASSATCTSVRPPSWACSSRNLVRTRMPAWSSAGWCQGLQPRRWVWQSVT